MQEANLKKRNADNQPSNVSASASAAAANPGSGLQDEMARTLAARKKGQSISPVSHHSKDAPPLQPKQTRNLKLIDLISGFLDPNEGFSKFVYKLFRDDEGKWELERWIPKDFKLNEKDPPKQTIPLSTIPGLEEELIPLKDRPLENITSGELFKAKVKIQAYHNALVDQKKLAVKSESEHAASAPTPIAPANDPMALLRAKLAERNQKMTTGAAASSAAASNTPASAPVIVRKAPRPGGGSQGSSD